MSSSAVSLFEHTNNMTNAVYSELVRQIRLNRTWIDVDIDNARCEFMAASGGVLKAGLFRSMIFICKVPFYGKRRGYRWVIPEFEIDKAIQMLQSDAKFARRIQRAALTMDDAEKIIYHASYGILKLDLEEW